MCGIVGIIGNKPFARDEIDAFEGMLVLASDRGEAATGVIAVLDEGESFKTIKSDQSSDRFLRGADWKEWKEKLQACKVYGLIGHARFPTTGENSVAHAHPFVMGDRKQTRLALVHNGTLGHVHRRDVDQFGVDSKFIADEIYNKGTKSIENIDGAMALAWHDERNKCISIFRNTERPLYISNGLDHFLFGSEKNYIKSAAYRLSEAVKKDYVVMLLDHNIVNITYDREGMAFENVKVKHYSYFASRSSSLPVVSTKKDASVKKGYSHHLSYKEKGNSINARIKSGNNTYKFVGCKDVKYGYPHLESICARGTSLYKVGDRIKFFISDYYDYAGFNHPGKQYMKIIGVPDGKGDTTLFRVQFHSDKFSDADLMSAFSFSGTISYMRFLDDAELDEGGVILIGCSDVELSEILDTEDQV